MISEPVNGGTLKADEQENDLYTTAVVVRGVAEPDARVVVSTGCKDEACQKAVRTASDGAFEAEVSLAVEAEKPRGTIIVGYEDSGESVDSDRVIVTVEPPGVADLPTEDNTSKSKKKKSSKKKAAPLPTSAPPEATAPPSSTTAPSTSSGSTTSARNLVVIGDSLAVGMQPFLQQYLQGWNITVDARVGRPLAEGMRQFDAKPDPSNETVYAFSLFTNDGPTNVTALESAVKRSTTKGCAVWSTIVRPPVGGTSYDGANSTPQQPRLQPRQGRPVGRPGGQEPGLDRGRRRPRRPRRATATAPRSTPRRSRPAQAEHGLGVTTFGSGIGSGRPATLQNA